MAREPTWEEKVLSILRSEHVLNGCVPKNLWCNLKLSSLKIAYEGKILASADSGLVLASSQHSQDILSSYFSTWPSHSKNQETKILNSSWLPFNITNQSLCLCV